MKATTAETAAHSRVVAVAVVLVSAVTGRSGLVEQVAPQPAIVSLDRLFRTLAVAAVAAAQQVVPQERMPVPVVATTRLARRPRRIVAAVVAVAAITQAAGLVLRVVSCCVG